MLRERECMSIVTKSTPLFVKNMRKKENMCPGWVKKNAVPRSDRCLHVFKPVRVHFCIRWCSSAHTDMAHSYMYVCPKLLRLSKYDISKYCKGGKV